MLGVFSLHEGKDSYLVISAKLQSDEGSPSFHAWQCVLLCGKISVRVEEEVGQRKCCNCAKPWQSQQSFPMEKIQLEMFEK